MILVSCPFCGETDFDYEGLTKHLAGWQNPITGSRLVCDAEPKTEDKQATHSAIYETIDGDSCDGNGKLLPEVE